MELLAHKSKSPALKLNNNMISKWEGFWETLSGLFVDPSKNLQWLDLSFNDLREIDKVSTYALVIIGPLFINSIDKLLKSINKSRS